MSSPIEQFSSLSIQTPMTSSVHDFDERKTIVQDILSSFSREILPSEFRPDLFRSIQREQGRPRPESEWTIPGDLEGTLMQWGVHDDPFYSLLDRIQPQGTRSILFHQKIDRRLKAEVENYGNIDRSAPAASIRYEVQQISNNLRDILEASWDRQVAERRAIAADVFIDTLSSVCENHLDLAGGGRRTRRSSGSQAEASLFYMLVIDPQPGQDHFMLGFLEWMATNFVDVLSEHRDSLEGLARRLVTLNAPEPYRNMFQEIIDKVKGNKESEQGAGAGLPRPPPPPGSARPSGTKRPAGDAPGRKAGKRKMGT